MNSSGKGSGRFPESASANMEAGIAGQTMGQQGSCSGSNTVDPWGDYLNLQRQQQFVQQAVNQGGPRIPSTPTGNGSRGGSSSPNVQQGAVWNQGAAM